MGPPHSKKILKAGLNSVAKILAPCLPMPKRNMETEFRGNRKEELYYFCQAKEKHSRLVSQELCPPFSRIGRGLISSWKFCFFFFLLQSFKMAPAGIRQLSNWVLCSEVIRLWPFFWDGECYKSVGGKESQVLGIVYGSESNLLWEGQVQLQVFVSSNS